MSKALEDLIATLTLDPIAENVYRGRGSWGDGADATYGGHFLGQATAAALARVDPERAIHSLHAYFLAPGQPQRPIDYTVTTVREGHSFSTRRVSASQGDRVLFELTASFQRPESGRVLDSSPPDDFDRLPAPESLMPYRELMASYETVPLPAEWALREHGVDIRPVNAPWASAGPSAAGGIRQWIRADGVMPDEPSLHAAMLAYQSDESLADNVLVPFGLTWGSPGVMLVSLDHAMWYYRPFRMDEWLFVEQWPIAAAQARGLATARVWNASGKLVASFTQEALMRLGPRSDSASEPA